MTEVKTLAKGERLPKHKYKQFHSMCAEYHYYYLWDENENLIGELYKPRWQHMPRKLRIIDGKGA